VPLQFPVRPHFGIFWDFSDSFVTEFYEVRTYTRPANG
jgi:hypothetical protein